MISVATLVVATGCRPDDAERYAQPLSDTFDKWEINTPRRQAYFLGQVAHESALFTRIEEDLFYSTALRLVQIYPRYFPTPNDAKPYLKNPEKLANKVYASKIGNGSEQSGDGWKYRGRGLIQITGRANYETYQTRSNVGALSDPDLLLDATFAADSAGWFWNSHDLNRQADKDQLKQITQAINGGQNGYDQRLLLTERAKRALKVF